MDIALVHGSYHGSWCWNLLRPELERLGQRTLAIDLPISEPGLGAAAYAQVVVDALEGWTDPVVVGHSMAGLVIPLVAARRHVRRLIYLAALLPEPGKSMNEQRRTQPVDSGFQPTTAEWTDLGDDVWMVGPNTATEVFFHDVPTSVGRWATQRLRPQAYTVMNEVTPLQAWPEVEARAIVCADDRAVNPAWVRSACRQRLGVEATELPGGHSPFLSRPAELASLLTLP